MQSGCARLDNRGAGTELQGCAGIVTVFICSLPWFLTHDTTSQFKQSECILNYIKAVGQPFSFVLIVHFQAEQLSQSTNVSVYTSVLLQREAHPVVRQLKSHLNEGVGTDSTLLDPSFGKGSVGEDVELHVIGQGLGDRQRLGDLLLALREANPNTEHQQE